MKATCPEKAEGLAMLLHGAPWSKDLNLSNFWLEGNCGRILKNTKGVEGLVKWQNQGLVKEAIEIPRGCNHFLGFKFIPRSLNQVADKLAENDKNNIFFEGGIRSTKKPTFVLFLTVFNKFKLGSYISKLPFNKSKQITYLN